MDGDTFPEFRAALAEAERQLQWGIDADVMDAVAARLEEVDPGSLLAVQLARKAARSRAYKRPPLVPDNIDFVESPTHTTSAGEPQQPEPAGDPSLECAGEPEPIRRIA